MLRRCQGNITRISKPIARKLHKTGKDIFIAPCNMIFDNHWEKYSVIPREEDFDRFVNYFEIYGCTTKQQGLYAAFYTKIENENKND